MRALLLPGCGARAVIQAGQISAYLGKYKTYDALYGTSAGSINGTMLHQGEVPEMINLWKTINNSKIFDWNLLKAFGPEASLASTKPLERLLGQVLNLDKLKQNPVPFYVTATCVSPLEAKTLKMPLLNASSTVAWLLSSASAPIMFPTQQIGTCQYTDGGLLRDLNIAAAIAAGYTEIVVLWPSNVSSRPVRNLIDMLDLMLTAQGTAQYEEETELVRLLKQSESGLSLTIYRPTFGVDLGLLDFDKAGRNFEKYYNMGYDLLIKPAVQFRKIANRWVKT